MNKDKILTSDLFDCQIPYLKQAFIDSKYPFELLPKIKEIIKDLLEKGIEGYNLLEEGILIGQNVRISKTSTLIPPLIIGNNVEIRPGAFLRGNVIIGDNSVIGNSSELKNSILLEKVQVPHYNYVGDSILGNHSHLGAGAICSNLKSDGKNVVIHGENDYQTGIRKVGSFVADEADVGCGSVLNPGTVIGKHSRVYPLSMVRGVIKENCIYKNKDEIIEITGEK